MTKTIDTAELVAAIERVAARDAYFSPRLAAFVLQAFSAPEPTQARDAGLAALTVREREVLHHLARGYAYKFAPRASQGMFCRGGNLGVGLRVGRPHLATFQGTASG